MAVSKFSQKVKKISRKGTVDFVTDEGEVISFEVQSFGRKTFDALNDKYEELKPKVPTKKLPSKNGVKIINDDQNPDYLKKLGDVMSRRMVEIALISLSPEERPDGGVEEQLDALEGVDLAGFVPKIVQKGLELSGLIESQDDYEEEVDEAKK